ncbi:MAG TPA: biotin--[acetyl-CoA-carboxylase] ligase [Chthoniobacterales bacterium]|jgi:BirA family biotin operon repressor/biotin-[acetyl-CoA-carboxylase] ligase
MSAPDRLRPDQLRAALGPVTIGREIVVVEETPSTNDMVGEMGGNGRKEGVVVFAEHQTAGRGQRGNKWESAAYKGLWFSMLLRPAIDLKESTRLTEWAAQAIASTIRNSYSLPAEIELPNDIYVGNRKVAGVLVEMRAQPRSPHFAVVGIGLNVNHTQDDFPAELRDRSTSLAIESGSQQDRSELAVALLRNMDRSYGNLIAGK